MNHAHKRKKHAITAAILNSILISSILIMPFQTFAYQDATIKKQADIVEQNQESQSRNHERQAVAVLAVLQGVEAVASTITSITTIISTIADGVKPNTTEDMLTNIQRDTTQILTQLKAVNQKLDDIQGEFKALNDQLNVQHQETLLKITDNNFKTPIDDFNAAYTKLSSVEPYLASTDTLKNAPAKVEEIYNYLENKTDLHKNLGQFNTALLGTTDGKHGGALDEYTKLLKAKLTATADKYKIDLTKAYNCLFNYYMLRLFQQYQGLLIYREYVFEHSRRNSLDGQTEFNDYYDNTFVTKHIVPQCEFFLECVDRLVAASAELSSSYGTDTPFFNDQNTQIVDNIYKQTKFLLQAIAPNKYQQGLHITVLGEPQTVTDTQFEVAFSAPTSHNNQTYQQDATKCDTNPYFQWESNQNYQNSFSVVKKINICHFQIDNLTIGESFTYSFSNPSGTVTNRSNETQGQSGAVHWHSKNLEDHGINQQADDVKFCHKLWIARNLKAIPMMSFRNNHGTKSFGDYNAFSHKPTTDYSANYQYALYPSCYVTFFRPTTIYGYLFCYTSEYSFKNVGQTDNFIKMVLKNTYGCSINMNMKYAEGGVRTISSPCQLNPSSMKTLIPFNDTTKQSEYWATFNLHTPQNTAVNYYRCGRFYFERDWGLIKGGAFVYMSSQEYSLEPVTSTKREYTVLNQQPRNKQQSRASDTAKELKLIKFSPKQKKGERSKIFNFDSSKLLGESWELINIDKFGIDQENKMLFYNLEAKSFKLIDLEFDDETLELSTTENNLDFLTLDEGFSYAGSGDYNGDGITDLLIQEDASGDLYAYFVYDNCQDGCSLLLNNDEENPLSYICSGDFNGDGIDDILTYDEINVLYQGHLIVAGEITDTGYIYDPSFKQEGDWSLFSCVDCNQDGMADLIWVDEETQTPYFSLLCGLEVIQEGTPKLSGKPYKRKCILSDVGDYNQDGQPDLLWVKTSKKQGGDITLLINYLDGMDILNKRQPRIKQFKCKDLASGEWLPVLFKD